MKDHGFALIESRYLDELKSTLYEYEYTRTGTHLFYMDNGLDNKLFSIAFKTIPFDDSGVFHILEHSVLCGSEKYPVKEPFVELMKSSLNTFLNAMTFPDMTMYPVSSRNEKDFFNLMDVYLDSVLHPNILRNRNIFLQEGWHVEKDESGELTYKGVVFNEMKGEMDGTDRIEEEAVLKQLFKDNCYGFNSGGEPSAIPSLTYEKFIETYKKFYHPSNAVIYLDGAVDLDKAFEKLDTFLSDFERLDIDTDIPLQVMRPSYSEELFDVSESDSSRKNRVVFSGIAGTFMDKTDIMALDIINGILTASNDSPLSKAIIESGLAQNIFTGIDKSVQQPFYTFSLRNVDDRDTDRVIEFTREKLRQFAEEGLDTDSIESAINYMEFYTKELNEPSGLIRCINLMNSVLYGGDPTLYLLNDDTFAELRSRVGTGYYEDLIKKYFLSDEYCVTKLIPSTEAGNIKREREKDALRALKESLSEEEINDIDVMNKALTEWQETPDSEEALSTIPKLRLEDVEEEPDLISTETFDCSGIPVMFHRELTQGVSYFNLYFHAGSLMLEDLPKLTVFTRLLKNLDTSHHEAYDLQNYIRRYVGQMTVTPMTINRLGRKDCSPYVLATISCLRQNSQISFKILKEVLTETLFTSKDKIRNEINDMYDMLINEISEAGVSYAMGSVMNQFRSSGAADEYINGVEFLRYIHAFHEDFEKYYDDLISFQEHVVNRLFSRDNLIVSLTDDEKRNISDLIYVFDKGSKGINDAYYSLKERSGFMLRIPSQINYAAKALSLDRLGMKYRGQMTVAANILSLEYLWTNIRVMGGAYGSGMNIMANGNMYCYSYRDPSPLNSLTVFRGFADALRSFLETSPDIDQYIISAVGNNEPLLAPKAKGRLEDRRIMSGITYEYRKQCRKEMLSTSVRDLYELLPLFEGFDAQGRTVIVGSDSEAREQLETEDII
ncbi:MAG: insulinase family protein [Clostridia bacterium]|nr:insulinase family protein [Clostridia bacterium]